MLISLIAFGMLLGFAIIYAINGNIIGLFVNIALAIWNLYFYILY